MFNCSQLNNFINLNKSPVNKIVFKKGKKSQVLHYNRPVLSENLKQQNRDIVLIKKIILKFYWNKYHQAKLSLNFQILKLNQFVLMIPPKKLLLISNLLVDYFHKYISNFLNKKEVL